MAKRTTPLALYHVLDAIRDFQNILCNADLATIAGDVARRYAAERCVEIISEASRRIPDAWKAEHPNIPWDKIAGIGNIIRHNYDDVSLDLILDLRSQYIRELETAVLALLGKYDPAGRPWFRPP